MKVSRFLHVKHGEGSLSGYSVLYNALTLGVVIVPRGTADRIVSLKGGGDVDISRIFPDNFLPPEEIISELKKHRILLACSDSEYQDYSIVWHTLTYSRIGVLYLLLTDDCNMRCTYCHIMNGMPENYNYSKMTPEIVKYGIDLFAKSLSKSWTYGMKEPRILLHGGEPLLNTPAIISSLDIIRNYKSAGKLPENTQVSMNTNGTLVTPEIARILAENDVKVAVSIDGWKSVHDVCRVYRNGKNNGTFYDAVRGFNILRENGASLAVSCTITPSNIDSIEEVLEWLSDNFKIASISFNPFISSEVWDREMAKEWAEKVAEKLIRCFCICRERGIYEGRLMRNVRAFVQGLILYSNCAGCGQQIVVDPKGNVGICSAYCGTKEYFVPYGEEFDPLNHPYWNEWRLRSPLVMPQCLNCEALSVCGGGCPQSAQRQNGSIWELDEIFCVVAKKTVDFLLGDILEKKLSIV
jgi:uncharacterized protein